MKKKLAVNRDEDTQDTYQVKVFSSDVHELEKYKLFYDFFKSQLSSQDITDLIGEEARVVPVRRRSSESYDPEILATNDPFKNTNEELDKIQRNNTNDSCHTPNILRKNKKPLNPIVYTDEEDDAPDIKFTAALNLKPKTVGPSCCPGSKASLKNVKKQGKTKITQITNENSTNVVENQQEFNKSDKTVSKRKATTNKGSKRKNIKSITETKTRETLDNETDSTIESDSDVSYEDNFSPGTDSVSPLSSAEECEMLSDAETPRRWTRITTCHVLITEVPQKEEKWLKEQLQRLGAVIVTDVMQSTVVVTLQIKRTFKVLCAVGLGKPIVGPDWVRACANNKLISDPWKYILKDVKKEKEFSFRLKLSLTKKEGNFLNRCDLSATPSVVPSASHMKLIVECSGGTWIEAESYPAVNDCSDRWTCVSCEADRVLWPDLLNRGAILVCTDYFFDAVLQQTLDVKGKALTKQRAFESSVEEYIKHRLNSIVCTDEDDDVIDMSYYIGASKTSESSYCYNSKPNTMKNDNKQGKHKVNQTENENSTIVAEKQQELKEKHKMYGSKCKKRKSKNETKTRETSDNETDSTIESDSDISYEDFTKKKRHVSTESKSGTSRTTNRTNESIEEIKTIDTDDHYSTTMTAWGESNRPRTSYVLITAVPPEEEETMKETLITLEAVIVTDIMKCTAVVTLQIERSLQLLCARGLRIPIVGPSWVRACARFERIVDPWKHLIRDVKAENRFRDMEGSFLFGYSLSATPSVNPPASEMKLIVECSGGTWKEGGAGWMCVSCDADRALWPDLVNRGAMLVCPAYILGAVMKQTFLEVTRETKNEQKAFQARVKAYLSAAQ